MLRHPTLDKLQALRLPGMLKALTEQQQMPDINSLGFEERLGLLVDREMTERENRRLATRLKKASLRQSASLEDLDFKSSRGLDRALILSLVACTWIARGINVLICGPTGVGKSYLACALAHKACLQGYSALYLRLPRLFEELSIGRLHSARPPGASNRSARTRRPRVRARVNVSHARSTRSSRPRTAFSCASRFARRSHLRSAARFSRG